MNDKKLQLVSFSQAKRLKAAGFDWEVDNFYNGEDLVYCWMFFDRTAEDLRSNYNCKFEWEYGTVQEFISAPTVALALKWMYTVHNIYGCVMKMDWFKEPGQFEYRYILPNSENYSCGSYRFDTPDEAGSYLLDELLTILEKEK